MWGGGGRQPAGSRENGAPSWAPPAGAPGPTKGSLTLTPGGPGGPCGGREGRGLRSEPLPPRGQPSPREHKPLQGSELLSETVCPQRPEHPEIPPEGSVLSSAQTLDSTPTGRGAGVQNSQHGAPPDAASARREAAVRHPGAGLVRPRSDPKGLHHLEALKQPSDPPGQSPWTEGRDSPTVPALGSHLARRQGS